MTLNKGDKVTVLDDAIDGVVTEVKGNEVTIETTDGFHLTFKLGELLKMDQGELRIDFNKNRRKKFWYPSLICTLKNWSKTTNR